MPLSATNPALLSLYAALPDQVIGMNSARTFGAPPVAIPFLIISKELSSFNPVNYGD